MRQEVRFRQGVHGVIGEACNVGVTRSRDSFSASLDFSWWVTAAGISAR
jgi:hypothetical protein